VDDALGGELLHHAPGGYFVVFWVTQAAGDGLERLNKFGEISELVERFSFVFREGIRVVAGA
jgi:hypothetical protein